MLSGKWPAKRHDGTQIATEEKWREKMAGKTFTTIGVFASRKFVNSMLPWIMKVCQMGDYYHWRFKPKLHLFAELMQATIKTSGAPQLFWTYLDEGWTDWLPQADRPRGGRIVPATLALKLLQRFRAYMDKLMSQNLCAFLSHLGPA